jgi:hypothetical protein
MSNQYNQQPQQNYTNYNGAQNNGQYGAPGQQQWNGQYNPNQNNQYAQYAQNGQYGQYGQANNAVPAYARPQPGQYQQDSFLKQWLVSRLIIRLAVYAFFLILALGFCGFIVFAAMLSH